MEVFDGGLMSLWLVDRTIMVSPFAFDEKLYSENGDDLRRQMLGITKSKFDNLNVFSDVLEGYSTIHAFAVIGEGTVEFPDFGIKHTIGPGDFMAYRDDLNVILGAPVIPREFSYNNAPKSYGNGEKVYEVTATIRDDYKISVHANSPEEAIAIAESVSISEWRHPDVLEDSHLEDRRLVRHARWGNLSVNEIKD